MAWLAVWFPIYWHVWGLANFAHLCDIALILTCVALWTRNTLLLSSQAVSMLVVDAVWALDVAWKVAFGQDVFGGTAYLFDTHYALWVRLLTLFHVATPAVLLWSMARVGYDRRGWLLQCAIAVPAFAAARFTTPAENINFVFRDPFFHRQWGSAPEQVAINVAFMALVVYWPTHWALKKLFRAARPNSIGP